MYPYNYWEYKRTERKLKLQKLKPRFDNVTFATFCKLRELAQILNFSDPKPEVYGLTQKQIDDFLKNDRYVSANLLLKEIERAKKQEISETTKTIREKYQKQKDIWWEFTKRGQRKHEINDD